MVTIIFSYTVLIDFVLAGIGTGDHSQHAGDNLPGSIWKLNSPNAIDSSDSFLLLSVSVHRLLEQRIHHCPDRGQAVHPELSCCRKRRPHHQGHASIWPWSIFEVIIIIFKYFIALSFSVLLCSIIWQKNLSISLAWAGFIDICP